MFGLFLKQNKKIISFLMATLFFSVLINIAFAQSFNQQINYQGKLTDNLGATVADGTYNIAFNLHTAASGGTPVWSSTTTVDVANGLFSYMLGEDDSLSGVDFNQTLYLGVNVGGIGAPSWDGEMSPRKTLGAVPAAFEAGNAQTLDNIATSSFMRSDITNSATALLTFLGGASTTELTAATATVTTISIDGENFTTLDGSGLENTGGSLSANISEANLNITGSPTNGYLLQASSTATGGFVWAASTTIGIHDAVTLNTASYDYLTISGQEITLTELDITDDTNLSVNAEGLALSNDQIVLSGGYAIPLTASTTQWDTAYGWGDHGLVGYLTDLTTSNLGSLANVDDTNSATGTLLSYNGASWATTSTSSLNINTDDLTEGTNQFFTNTRARDAISETITGLTYTSGTGVFSLDGAYNIPLTASTSEWNTFYQTPSNRISAGEALSWTSNTINLDISSLSTGTDWGTGDYLVYEDDGGNIHKVAYDNLPGAGGGVTSLNGETGDTQTFATTSDTNITLSVISAGDTHTFNPGWTGQLAVTRGGTGAANAGDARTNLGLAIGSDVQAWDTDLDTWAGVTPSANGQSLVSAADYASMRGLLDLEAGTDFYSIAAADTAFEGELDNEAGLYTALSDVSDFYQPGEALDSGSITSGFGNIDIGSSNISADGTVTFGGLINGLLMANGSGLLSAVATNTLNIDLADTTGTLLASSFPALTGDVTSSAGSLTTAIANDVIAFGDISYALTLGGNPALGAGESFFGTTGLIFEGSSADTLEGLLTSANITGSDKTWTLPNTTGTLITTGDSGTVTGTMISNNTVGLADVTHTDTLAGNPSLAASQCFWASTGIICEGSGADTNETLLTFTNPTTDRTITFPDESITVAGLASAMTGTFDGNNFAGGAISSGDLLYGSGAGAISELGIGTTGQVLWVSGGLPVWTSTSTLGLGGGTTISFGSDNQIPIMNAGGTDYEYTGNLTFNGNDLNLGVSNGLAFGGTRFFYASTTNDSIAIGESAGSSFNASTLNNIAIGNSAGQLDSSGSYNIFMGLNSGQLNSGSDNNIIGPFAGQQNSGSYNNFIGRSAGSRNKGDYNDLIGYQAGSWINSTNTIAIGAQALYGAVGLTDIVNNTVLGYGAGYGARTGADNNILIGYQAADSLTTGANNIIIGYDIEAPSNTADGQLNIGNLIFGTDIDGVGTNLSSGNVGIGTTSPASKLDVWGDFRVGTSETPTLAVDVASGFVGIGSSTPRDLLTLQSPYSETADNMVFSIHANNGDVITELRADGRQYWYMDGSTNKAIGFATPSSLPGLFFDSNGYSARVAGRSGGLNMTVENNAGIGFHPPTNLLTAPEGDFHVWSDLGTRPTVIFEAQSGQTGSIQEWWSGNDIVLGAISPDGDFGFGTTSLSARLSIQGTSTNDLLNLFKTNGTEVFTVLENGNVGIGTTSPASKLDVWGDFRVGTSSIPSLFVDNANQSVGIFNDDPFNNVSSQGNRFVVGNTGMANAGITIQNSAASNGSLVFSDLAGTGSGSRMGRITYNHNNDEFQFITNSTQKMVIQSDGDVGIGTTSPTSKLTLAQSADSNGLSIRGFDNESNEGADLYVDSAGIFVINASGPTGAGYLSAGGTNVAAWTSARLILADNKELSFGNSNDYSWGYNSADDTIRLVDGDEVSSDANTRLVVNSSGNVGIGTTSPASKLDVWGDLRVGTSSIPSLFVDNANQSVGIFNDDPFNNVSSQGNELVIGNDTLGSSGLTIMNQVNGSGYVVFGDTHSTGAAAREGRIQYVHSSNQMRFITKGVQQMVIESGGNVGIGTTSPSAQLTLNGTLRLESITGGSLTTDSLGNVTVSSDERLKDLKGSFDRGLAELTNIEPILYRWNETSGYDTGTAYAGFSAQNILEFIPEAVGKNPDGYLTLSDRPIIATLVNSSKEQQLQLSQLLRSGSTTIGNDLITPVLNEEGTLWSKLVELTQGFIDGILTVTGIKTEKVETSELCVDGVCINAGDLRSLLQLKNNQSPTTGTEAEVNDETTEEESEEDSTNPADAGGSTNSSTGSVEGNEEEFSTATTSADVSTSSEDVTMDSEGVETVESDLGTSTTDSDLLEVEGIVLPEEENSEATDEASESSNAEEEENVIAEDTTEEEDEEDEEDEEELDSESQPEPEPDEESVV